MLPFLDLQYLYGLRACRPGRGRRAAAATSRPSHRRAAFEPRCLGSGSACRPAHGLRAHARGDFAAAIDGLGLALPRLVEIGGSHAQRDLFEQVYLDALVRLGTEASLAGAQGILQQQVNRQPESLRLRKQAAAVCARLGLPAFG